MELLSLEPNEVFPTKELLDHIPTLIREVANYVRAPEAEAVGANTAIITKAQELGAPRRRNRHPCTNCSPSTACSVAF